MGDSLSHLDDLLGREKLNISWKSGQNALCKVFYVNLVTRFFFLLTSEKLVAKHKM